MIPKEAYNYFYHIFNKLRTESQNSYQVTVYYEAVLYSSQTVMGGLKCLS